MQVSETSKSLRDELDSLYKKTKREKSDSMNEIKHLKEKLKQSNTLSGVVKDALGSMGFVV